ncbi:MAG: BON domain-containing protein [Burkholderiales bacterium]|nr:BON domain-containing protein [Burkholderiales bacterium]
MASTQNKNALIRPARLGVLLLAVLAATQLTACFPLVVAGAGAGIVSAQDRRSTATQWNDKQIESRVGKSIDAHYGDLTHVNVNAYNRAVLLTGEVPDEAAKAAIEKLARETQDVKQVYNELAVMLPSSFSSRTADVGVSTKIRARIVDAKKVSVIFVKVTTERRVAYLMGQVTRQEAADAAQTASETEGVERVVTLFEYMD